MDTLFIEYSVRNALAGRILQGFSKFIGARVKQEYVPTAEELEAIDRSLKSGTASIDELKEILSKC